MKINVPRQISVYKICKTILITYHDVFGPRIRGACHPSPVISIRHVTCYLSRPAYPKAAIGTFSTRLEEMPAAPAHVRLFHPQKHALENVPVLGSSTAHYTAHMPEQHTKTHVPAPSTDGTSFRERRRPHRGGIGVMCRLGDEREGTQLQGLQRHWTNTTPVPVTVRLRVGTMPICYRLFCKSACYSQPAVNRMTGSNYSRYTEALYTLGLLAQECEGWSQMWLRPFPQLVNGSYRNRGPLWYVSFTALYLQVKLDFFVRN